jgi:Flp pilus assembly protein TadG
MTISYKPVMRRSSRRSGSTLVEFAMVVLVFIPIMMGIMEFGVLVKNHLLVANAVREGARAAATGKSTGDVEARVKRFVAPLSVTGMCNTTVANNCVGMTFSTDEGKTSSVLANTTTTPVRNNATPGSLISITVNTRHRPLTGFFWFMKNRDIVTTVTMRRE